MSGNAQSVINKIESGYLQFLRVAFLVVATIALILAVVLGVRAAINYNAKPKAVSDSFAVNSADFTMPPPTSPATAPGTQLPPALNQEKNKLENYIHKFADILKKHNVLGKQRDASEWFNVSLLTLQIPVFSRNDDIMSDCYNIDSTCADAFLAYADQVLSRSDVENTVHDSPKVVFDVMHQMTVQFLTSYKKEKDRIASEKEEAQHEALEKRASALASISAIGILIGAFVVLVLMLVLLRVDRSIREIAAAQDGRLS